MFLAIFEIKHFRSNGDHFRKSGISEKAGNAQSEDINGITADKVHLSAESVGSVMSSSPLIKRPFQCKQNEKPHSYHSFKK